MGLYFYLNYAICLQLIYDLFDYLGNGHVFFDIFSITNDSCMHLKFYLGLPLQKFGIQIGSGTDDIGMLLLGDMRYTSLDPT